MNVISFNTANYVARQVNYQMTGGWGQGDRSSNEHFKPVATFAQRFETYLKGVKEAGFHALDLWSSIVSPEWAADDQIKTAVELCRQYDLEVVSFAGWFGSSVEVFERMCQIAAAFGQPLLGGSTSVLTKDRQALVDLLKKYNLKLGVENHPEKTPAELLERMGDDGEGTIGVCVDTGWFGTQGYDAAKALEELKDHLLFVHLKDVLAEGEHETCRLGKGVVPVEKCIRTLQKIGYTGAISIEHEPELYDPTPDVIAGREMVEGWLG